MPASGPPLLTAGPCNSPSLPRAASASRDVPAANQRDGASAAGAARLRAGTAEAARTAARWYSQTHDGARSRREGGQPYAVRNELDRMLTQTTRPGGLLMVASLARVAVCAVSVAGCGSALQPVAPKSCGHPGAEAVAVRVRAAHGAMLPATASFAQTYFFGHAKLGRTKPGTVRITPDGASWKYDNGNIMTCRAGTVSVLSGPPGQPAYEVPLKQSDCGLFLSFLRRQEWRSLGLATTGCGDSSSYVLTAVFDVEPHGCRTMVLFVEGGTNRIRTVTFTGAGPDNRIDVDWRDPGAAGG
mgnify:CR=1 FL=1